MAKADVSGGQDEERLYNTPCCGLGTYILFHFYDKQRKGNP